MFPSNEQGQASVNLVYAVRDDLIRRIAQAVGGVDQFTELIDCPPSYSGFAGNFPVVNTAETALIFGNLFPAGAVIIDVEAATTAALAANTYNNGAAGVGATITINANGVFPTIDSQAAVLNKIYLIKNETGSNRLKNGIYRLSTIGTAGTQAVLTRVTGADSSAELTNLVAFCSYNTGTNKNRYFIQATDSPTVGTSPIIWGAPAGGGTSAAPGGANTAIQINGNGSFTGDATFQYDTATGTFTIRSVPYVFPAADAVGALVSDGAGALSWTGVMLADGTIPGATAQAQAFTLGVSTNLLQDNGDDFSILQNTVNKILVIANQSTSIEVNGTSDTVSITAAGGLAASLLTCPSIEAGTSQSLTIDVVTVGNDLTLSTSTITVTMDDGLEQIIVTATSGIDCTKFLSNLYQDSGAAMVIEQSTANNLTVINTPAGGQIQLTSAGNARLMTTSIAFSLIESSATTTLVAAGGMTVQSTGGTITLTPDTGWTASVGTASKAGIDSDDVIYTVGALQNLARVVVAIQNRLMAKGHFVA